MWRNKGSHDIVVGKAKSMVPMVIGKNLTFFIGIVVIRQGPPNPNLIDLIFGLINL
jgi:hypothetical protein